MRKILAILISFTLIGASLTGCNGNNQKFVNGKINIVTTIFPEYDWVRQILGDKAENAELTLLLENGVDLHSYQPSADDIIKISTCDMFIYVGGESDTWVDDALKNATNKDMVVLNLLEVLGDCVKAEEMVEGMQEEEHDHAHGEEEDHEGEDHDHEVEFDEHVWLSLKNAKVLCSEIANNLSVIDPDNKDTYAANLAAYNETLTVLDRNYKTVVNGAATKTVLFGDRFPFRYLVEDYGLDYYAAFVGCSAETEASFETITFLANKVNELRLSCILTIEGTNHKIAETIVSNTTGKNQKILSLDTMQSTTSKDIQNGVTYLSVMEKNLETLGEALK